VAKGGGPRNARRGRLQVGSPTDARRVALDALLRIDLDRGYANLVLPAMLADSALSDRDRAFVTELVYGTTRMGRACDWLVDRFLLREVEPEVRAALRLGAYQLAFLRVPSHAAVSATVAVVPPRARGVVNAVLRRVSEHPVDPDAGPDSGGWPDLATRLSYPDWIVRRLLADLGHDDTVAALGAMNEAAVVHERDDGYVQDTASQQVVELLGAGPGGRVLDLCAAPGGKATGVAGAGATVVAADSRRRRARLVTENAARLGLEGSVAVVVADGTRPPFAAGSFDHVLVDAPCSGLGSLRRRADARWRISEDAVERLARLQRHLVEAAVPLVRPGGVLVYSVCTLLDAETLALDTDLAASHPELIPLDVPGEPWRPLGRGARMLPQSDGSDGMALFRYRAPG
jgi:16S rRNA (cytosine967-C5)-methyltransferase